MDWTRLMGMLTRMFIRSAVDTGIKYAAGNGKSEAEMTPEERAQAKQAGALARRARDIARITRRFGR